MTDIDDTIICSGGGVAGADKACLGTTVKALYPGVVEFQLALSRGHVDAPTIDKVIPFSARPDELGLKYLLAIKAGDDKVMAYESVARKCGVQGWGLDVDKAQYGDAVDFADAAKAQLGAPGLDATHFDHMGRKKFENWLKLVSTFVKPSIFVGDNGQGDTIAAQMMIKYSASFLQGKGGSMSASFIHDVLGKCSAETCRSQWAKHGIFLFSHYPNAAGIALKNGLISKQGCLLVCQAFPDVACEC